MVVLSTGDVRAYNQHWVTYATMRIYKSRGWFWKSFGLQKEMEVEGKWWFIDSFSRNSSLLAVSIIFVARIRYQTVSI